MVTWKQQNKLVEWKAFVVIKCSDLKNKFLFYISFAAFGPMLEMAGNGRRLPCCLYWLGRLTWWNWFCSLFYCSLKGYTSFMWDLLAATRNLRDMKFLRGNFAYTGIFPSTMHLMYLYFLHSKFQIQFIIFSDYVQPGLNDWQYFHWNPRIHSKYKQLSK